MILAPQDRIAEQGVYENSHFSKEEYYEHAEKCLFRRGALEKVSKKCVTGNWRNSSITDFLSRYLAVFQKLFSSSICSNEPSVHFFLSEKRDAFVA